MFVSSGVIFKIESVQKLLVSEALDLLVGIFSNDFLTRGFEPLFGLSKQDVISIQAISTLGLGNGSLYQIDILCGSSRQDFLE